MVSPAVSSIPAVPTPQTAPSLDEATSLSTSDWRPVTRVFVMPFGKYRDRPISKVPRDYLNYLLAWDKLGESPREAIMAELERRAGSTQQVTRMISTYDATGLPSGPAATWQRVPDYVRWTQPGQALEGIWIGPVAGKFGPRGMVDRKDGTRVVFPLHAVLREVLTTITPGTQVVIVYDGLRCAAKTGRQYKSFHVFTK